ncbi:MAG: hypothetical protein ACLUTA_12910 [Blautia wexlerae]
MDIKMYIVENTSKWRAGSLIVKVRLPVSLMAKKMKEYQEREMKNVMIQMIENLNFFRDMVG